MEIRSDFSLGKLQACALQVFYPGINEEAAYNMPKGPQVVTAKGSAQVRVCTSINIFYSLKKYRESRLSIRSHPSEGTLLTRCSAGVWQAHWDPIACLTCDWMSLYRNRFSLKLTFCLIYPLFTWPQRGDLTLTLALLWEANDILKEPNTVK